MRVILLSLISRQCVKAKSFLYHRRIDNGLAIKMKEFFMMWLTICLLLLYVHAQECK